MSVDLSIPFIEKTFKKIQIYRLFSRKLPQNIENLSDVDFFQNVVLDSCNLHKTPITHTASAEWADGGDLRRARRGGGRCQFCDQAALSALVAARDVIRGGFRDARDCGQGICSKPQRSAKNAREIISTSLFRHKSGRTLLCRGVLSR